MTSAWNPSPGDDVIDQLAGIAPGSHLDAVRRHRLQARAQAQQSFLALLAPRAPLSSHWPLNERLAVAAFVAGLHQQPQVQRFYRDALATQASLALGKAIDAEVAQGLASGPYGQYPRGLLSAENQAGPVYAVGAQSRAVLGERLSAGLAHAHLLAFHPRDAQATHLQGLLDAGWSETDIVVLSQLVSFLAFQIRVVAGLRLLQAHPAPSTAAQQPTAEESAA
ncbi:CMD domain protein [Comamonas piscis]|uniref:CMD domain protein n=1 Tax=Comamonas piscis TaxID=1562974 RepID=A0A7G5ELI4_9BURK|nr:CMD domain protein [Comamonas piscis]QMV74859.1 CMD domain protein [Comamonas piscis]WSO33334.1 CMD domain protein [Comamonas piscis]